MTVLLQVSDPHFGTERAHVMAALQRLARELRPDILMLSGDITQRATRTQFAAARAFVDALGVPRLLSIPGNHDIPLFNMAARLFWPYARYRKAFGPALEFDFESDELLLLGLNTTRRYRHIDGELGLAQIERVAARLEQAPPTCWRIVVTHQPLAVSHRRDEHDRLHRHQQALERWSAAGADVVMGGHIHLPFVLDVQDNIPSLPRRLWAVQAGTALSHRVRADAPNSVNVLRIEAKKGMPHPLLIERWDFSDLTQRFACVATHRLPDAGKD